MSSTLLTIGDGRFPGGGHAHSGGLEEAVADRRVRTIEDLPAFLAGRLYTVGRVDASLCAFSWLVAPSTRLLAELEGEAEARAPSPAQRVASRAQGRALLRAAQSIWPTTGFCGISGVAAQFPRGPMYAVVLGAVGNGVGLSVRETALLAAQASVTGPAWASTRLLGLDPFAVGRCLSELAREVERAAMSAVEEAQDAYGRGDSGAALSAYSAPLLEVGAERHALWEVRLFAS